jgi:hypothetical protein
MTITAMRATLWLLLLAVWVTALATGMGALWAYKLTPGATGAPPAEWPSESRLRRVAGRPTLILVAHPECPCTRASLSELARLLARFPDRLTAYVLSKGPLTGPPIVGVLMLPDEDGVEAARLRVRTSGQTLLYDGRGRLVFSGGLTTARGHEGDSPGSAAIAAFLKRGEAGRPTSPVFGCSLEDPE